MEDFKSGEGSESNKITISNPADFAFLLRSAAAAHASAMDLRQKQLQKKDDEAKVDDDEADTDEIMEQDNLDDFGEEDEEEKAKKKEENNFGTTEFLLSMSSALDFDEKNKDKTKRELFVDKMETMCSSLSETKKDNSGFYWDYYVPYFVALKEKKHLEVLSYLVYAPSGEKEIMDWLKSNKEELEEFYKWSAEFEWYIS